MGSYPPPPSNPSARGRPVSVDDTTLFWSAGNERGDGAALSATPFNQPALPRGGASDRPSAAQMADFERNGVIDRVHGVNGGTRARIA